MQAVGALLQDNRHLPAAVASETGFCSAGMDAEFANRVNWRREREAVQYRIDGVDPVIDIRVVRFTQAIGLKSQPASSGTGRALGAWGNAGRQQRQIEKIPPVQRQIHNVVVGNHAAHRGGLQLDGRHLRAHRHLVAHVADFQHQVDARLFADGKHDAGLAQFLEARGRGLDLVFARGQRRNHVIALPVCFHRAGHAGEDAPSGDLGACDRAARRVPHLSANR